MFLFKSVNNLIFGDDPASSDGIKIESGEFYGRLVNRPKDPTLIFRDACLSIKKTSHEFNYQLVVTRIFEEGEEELELEKSDVIDDERTFLIDEEMKFKIEKEKTDEGLAHVLSWRGLDSRGNERLYEFVASTKNVSDNYVSTFLESVVGCVYERKNKASRDKATQDEVSKLAEDLAKADINQDPQSKASGSTTKKPAPKSTAKIILSVKADLLLFDEKMGGFTAIRDNADVWISQEVDQPFKFWLSVVEPIAGNVKHTQNLVCQPIEAEMNPYFSNKEHSFVWNFKEGPLFQSWLLSFPNIKDEIEFKGTFTRCLYESVNQSSFGKAKQEEQSYYEEAYNDKNAYEEIVAEPSDDESSSEEEEEPERVEKESFDQGKDTNSQLAVGYKNNRSYVVRGSRIGVFKHAARDQIEFASSINKVSDLSGKTFNPSKVMLHDQDSSMVLMNPLNHNTLYRMDLERGQVVEEWKVHDDIPCTDVFSSSKYSQMTPEQTLMGIGPNALYRIDPRINGPNKLVETELKKYATAQNFSCATTTLKGEIAVASKKGEIKLFDRCGINAKTALPAMGDAIISLDVTNDGRYIIATCKTYLLLVDVMIQSDPQKRLGFAKSFPKAEKPLPRRLQLKPEDVALMNQAVSFTPARFNAGQDSLEKHIVSSIGPFVIMWNFRKVKNGDLFAYSIRKYADNVVTDNFQFDQDRSIIVTLPNDVTITTKGQLRTPREALKSHRVSR
ncbi:Vacuolar import and degradation protein 27, variant 2 [Entomophthora muscae]|uniref:Vacuolar import and degradation protein 27, variant 2 n=1 Tax=Entomophthora muscae TaxID=34485 RepID=A0ACC2S9T9_9FUNG|nr:Vacuolar import and degradation protein 27, variant 2 [Entomophthora muscae]